MHTRLKNKLTAILIILSFFIMAAVSVSAIFALTQQNVETEVDFDYVAPSLDALTFTLSEDGNSYSVTDCDDSLIAGINGNLTIPSVYNGKPVLEIGKNAFKSKNNLVSITLEEGITTIGYSAFVSCSNLEYVTLPQSLNTITTKSLISLIFYDIQQPFAYCNKLKKIQVAEGNENFSSQGNCLVDLVNKVLITGCNTSAMPTDGRITSILDYAFYNCDEITKVDIPQGVTSVGSYAFGLCDNLEEIKIPNSVTSIKLTSLYECKSLKSIQVSSGNSVYHSSGNCLIETGNKKLVLGCRTSVIPNDNSVTSIGKSAFYECEGLTSITIPSSVTNIGEKAFMYCSSITNVVIPNSVTTLDIQAFYGCSNLQSVTISTSLTTIPVQTFCLCYNLKNVTIPSNIINIGSSAFNSTAITSITIPSGVTSIGQYAFNCDYLSNVTFANPNNWFVATSDDATTGTTLSATNLSNTSTAATYLTTTYIEQYWKRA